MAFLFTSSVCHGQEELPLNLAFPRPKRKKKRKVGQGLRALQGNTLVHLPNSAHEDPFRTLLSTQVPTGQ